MRASHSERNGFLKAQNHSMIITFIINTSSKSGLKSFSVVRFVGLSQVGRTIILNLMVIDVQLLMLMLMLEL